MKRFRSMKLFRGRLRPDVLALDGLFLTLGMCAAAFVQASRTTPVPVPVAAAEPFRVTEEAGRVVLAASTTGEREPLGAAVDAAPFRPDRTRPAVRYTVVANGAAAAPRPAPMRPPMPQLRLQGVAVLPNGGGLAALSVNGRPAQVVRVGQVVEGLRLVRVRAGAATLSRPDTTLVLQLPGTNRNPS